MAGLRHGSLLGHGRSARGYPELADLLAERHKIIGGNWQNAATAQLIARYLRRAVSILQQVDFTPAALRKNLASARPAPAYLFSAAELINHAADLSVANSVLTHDNERWWRIFPPADRADHPTGQQFLTRPVPARLHGARHPARRGRRGRTSLTRIQPEMA